MSTRPEPVLDQAKVASTVTTVVTALLSLLVVAGFLSSDETNGLTDALVGLAGGAATVVNAVVPIIRAKRARTQVTPLSDPRNSRGTALVPVTQRVEYRAATGSVVGEGYQLVLDESDPYNGGSMD